MTPAADAVSLDEIDEMFDLMVTNLQNEKKAIRVSGRSTIAEAKAAIARDEGRPMDQFKLTYKGKKLEECRSLNDCGITSAATIISSVPCLLSGGGPSLSYFFNPNEFDFKHDFDFSQMKDDGKRNMR